MARETNASHSAVTRLVGQLEAHFGVRLFHRTTRRLSLTEDGQDLLSHAHHLIEVAEGMEGALGAAPHLADRAGAGRHRRRPGRRCWRRGCSALLEQYPGL